MRKLWLVTTAWLAMSSAVSAQDATPPEQPPANEPPGPSDQPPAQPPSITPLEPGAEEVSVPAGAELTPAERVKAAQKVVAHGTTLSTRVTQLLDDARKRNDIIMVECLNDGLAQVNANLRNAQSRLERLKRAPDEGAQKHEYTVIAVVGAKFDALEQEIAQCIGQQMFETGTTEVTTEIDTSMLPFEENPTVPPIILPPTLPTVPPPASGQR